MAPRLRSIGSKLLWAIGVPGLLVALGGVTYFWRQADEAVITNSRQEAVALSELIATTFELTGAGATEDTSHGAVTEALRSDWRMLAQLRELRVVGTDGTIRWSRNPAEVGTLLPDAARVLGQQGGTTVFGEERAEVVRSLGGRKCAGCHDSAAAGGMGVLQLTVQPPDLRERVRGVFGRAFLSVVMLFGVVLGLTALSLFFFIDRPLRRLTRAMQRAEEGDFLVRAEVRSGDEIGALSSAFNRMLARLTAMKAEEIDTQRDLERAQAQLSLKVALEQTNAKLQRRIAEQALLFDVARSLTSTLELPELFGRITRLIGERVGVPEFSIMLLREGGLELVSAWPATAGTEGLRFEVGVGACGRAARTQHAVYVPDIQADQEIVERRAGQKEMSGSLLAVPMIHNGTVLGVINFDRPEVNAFGAEEIELLSAVADLAAIATQNAILHERTVALSITDPLTGAANRRHLFARLEVEVERALRYGTPLSVLMIDIDHFKHLNDVQGHRAGDRVLRTVCDLMASVTRKVDTLARYGGEEFLVILPQASRGEALEAAEKLRKTVAEAPLEEGHSQPLGHVSISIGVATLPRDSDTLDELIDCADSALYASKRGGRDLVTAFEPGMELHPGRERGPHAARRRRTGEQPATKVTGS
jgi:diguanylate cyclase (GGDEF)-like protein